MFWRVSCEEGAAAPDVEGGEPTARFVLHRHRDEAGEHLDLRLEQDGFLQGWRIDGTSLSGVNWATEKSPHPLSWLDDDGDAVREDSGVYAWEHLGSEGGTVLLHGRDGLRRVRIEREFGISARDARAVVEALSSCGAVSSDAAGLIADGTAARTRAVERLCGLGRELDGNAFDDAVWRKTLSGLTLDEIHGQLRAFEVRFDVKFPPQPVSVPEVLPEAEGASRFDVAMSIVRD